MYAGIVYDHLNCGSFYIQRAFQQYKACLCVCARHAYCPVGMNEVSYLFMLVITVAMCIVCVKHCGGAGLWIL